MPKPELNAVLTRKTVIRPGLALFRFRPEGWDLPPFRAGQYAMIGLPGTTPRHPDAVAEERPLAADKWVKKAYSISSPPTELEELEFYVVMVPNGQLTPRLFTLEEGDRAFIVPRLLGDFILEAPTDAKVAFVGTGTGIAPYVSMIRTHLHAHCERRYALFHGVRTSDELGFREELATRATTSECFSYLPCIDQPQQDASWTGLTGWAQEHWKSGTFSAALGSPVSPADTHVYLCGNPLMIEAMKETLRAEGFEMHSRKNPAGQIHVESFW
jgi:ferredoxin/flavodoxin---NADP+ reductase